MRYSIWRPSDVGKRHHFTPRDAGASAPWHFEVDGAAFEHHLALDENDDAVGDVGDRRDAILSTIRVATPLSRISRMMRQISSRMMGASAFGGLVEDDQTRVGQQARGRWPASAARRRTAGRRDWPAAGQRAGTARARAPPSSGAGHRRRRRSAIARFSVTLRRSENAAPLRHVGDAAAGDGEASASVSRPAPSDQHCARGARARVPSWCGSAWSCPCRCGPSGQWSRLSAMRERHAAQDVALAVVGVEVVAGEQRAIG